MLVVLNVTTKHKNVVYSLLFLINSVSRYLGSLIFILIVTMLNVLAPVYREQKLPIQLAQCRFPGLAISNAKILIYFSN